MLLIRVYEQWHGTFFIGDYFSAATRGSKMCVIIIFYLGSAFVVLCRSVLVGGRQLIFLVLCRKRDCFSWGYWCPWWVEWPGCGYNTGRFCLPSIALSWLFPGTLWPDEFHGKTWPNVEGYHLFVWESASLFAKVKCDWPQIFGCHLRGDFCFLKI